MPTSSDKEMALARVYAKAMIELANEQSATDDLLDELREFAAFLDANADFDAFISSPTVDTEARRAAIEKLFRGRASELFVDSLQVLNQKGRLAIVRSVVEAYRLEHEELHGRIDVYVRTATPLTDELRKRLQVSATKFAGKEAELIESIDESLIGGMIVQVGDQKIDKSVAIGLRRLRDALFARASAEIHSGKEYIVGAAGSQ